MAYLKKQRRHKVYHTRLNFLKRPLRMFRLNVVQGRFDALVTLETIPVGTFVPRRFNRACPDFGFKARGIATPGSPVWGLGDWLISHPRKKYHY